MTTLSVVAFSLFVGKFDAAVLRFSTSAVKNLEESYTFAQYIQNFGRGYTVGGEEYTQRQALFEMELAEVQTINARNAREGRLWKAGIHPFMDWTQQERKVLNGYKPSRAKGRNPSGLIQSGMHAFGRLNATRDAADDVEVMISGGLSLEAGPQLRNQGNCGSCWAISAVEAVEAQLQRAGHSDVSVSPQALVDCVPNPKHCGGSGGCDGATGELAYAFMRDYGIPLEDKLPYTAKTEQCPENPLSGAYPASTRVRVGTWDALPSNQAKPLMQALVSQGPVVVAVDGNSWFNYESGIFDGCDKDATLGHAVLAKGFGQDSGHDYWLIQNSWGRSWGEQGHIRLLKHADEDKWCGTDRSPKEGVGCDGGPPEVTVCGTCGILYDSLVPQDVRLETGDQQ